MCNLDYEAIKDIKVGQILSFYHTDNGSYHHELALITNKRYNEEDDMWEFECVFSPEQKGELNDYYLSTRCHNVSVYSYGDENYDLFEKEILESC